MHPPGLTGLLKHTDLVTSPPVHQSIVTLLLAMLSPQLTASSYGGRRGTLGPRHVSPAEAALVGCCLWGGGRLAN